MSSSSSHKRSYLIQSPNNSNNNTLARLHFGDILLKRSDGSAVSKVIHLGQVFNRGDGGLVHAGIACGSNHMYEMQGEGLVQSNFAEDRTQYTYTVYHTANKEWRRAAARVGKNIYNAVGFGTPRFKKENDKKLKYSMFQALKSLSISHSGYPSQKVLEHEYDLFLHGKSSIMCSAFVVFCYQYAACVNSAFSAVTSTTFPKSFQDYNPSYLAQALEKTGSGFTAVGGISSLSFGDASKNGKETADE
jgi:hypothetical protein